MWPNCSTAKLLFGLCGCLVIHHVRLVEEIEWLSVVIKQNRIFVVMSLCSLFYIVHSITRHRLLSAAEDARELAGDGVTNLGSLCGTTDVASLDALLDDDLDGLVDSLGELGLLQRVLEHHADGQEHGNGVDDALAGNVGCGTYRLNQWWELDDRNGEQIPWMGS